MADFINADDLFYREYEPKLQNRYVMLIELNPNLEMCFLQLLIILALLM